MRQALIAPIALTLSLSLAGCAAEAIEEHRQTDLDSLQARCSRAKVDPRRTPVVDSIVAEIPAGCSEDSRPPECAMTSLYVARMALRYPDAWPPSSRVELQLQAYPPPGGAVAYLRAMEHLVARDHNRRVEAQCDRAQDAIDARYDRQREEDDAARRAAIGGAFRAWGESLRQPSASAPVNCTSNAIGTSVYTHCQ